MAVKTRDEILEAIRTRLGEVTDDESIALIEDVTDTLESLENSDIEDWKKRYEENDEEWRRRYTERFYSNEPDVTEPDVTEPEKPKSFEELFKTE